MDRTEISTLHLFSGFRGSGKTTRLLELRESLRAAGHAVLYVNIEDVLDIRTPVDPGSFLIALTAAVEAAAGGQGGDPNDTEGYVAPNAGSGGWWDRARSLLMATSESYKLGFKFGPVNIAAELRENPSFVEQARRAGEANLAAFRQEAHEHVRELASRIKDALGEEGKVVLIVDSLDHADHRLRFEEIKNALYELFVTHRDLLRLDGMQWSTRCRRT